jgi:hypothetical protein
MKKDFEGIADFLHNGLEHSDIGEAKDHLYSEFGINKSVAHKMIDAWNGQDARKVLKYTLKDDIAWLKNFFDSNKDENMKLAEKVIGIHEGTVKGDKIDYVKAKEEMVSTAFHFIDGLRERKVSFSYNADTAKGTMSFKNLIDVDFQTGDENIWMDGVFDDAAFKGALTALTVVEKIMELDRYASKAK